VDMLKFLAQFLTLIIIMEYFNEILHSCFSVGSEEAKSFE